MSQFQYYADSFLIENLKSNIFLTWPFSSLAAERVDYMRVLEVGCDVLVVKVSEAGSVS